MTTSPSEHDVSHAPITSTDDDQEHWNLDNSGIGDDEQEADAGPFWMRDQDESILYPPRA